MSQSDRGIIYLALGQKHLCVLAVSVYTLRKRWQGPVTIFADEAAMPIVLKIAVAAQVERKVPSSQSCVGGPNMVDEVIGPCVVRRFNPSGHRAYAAKPMLPQLSPFAKTIQVDADTIWADSPEPLFDMLTPRSCLVTEFGNWISTGPRMRGRIEGWWKADPERVTRSLAKPYPAVNTGTVAYGCESPVAREVWLEETMKNPTAFMADELAMQILLPDYEDRPELLRVIDDQFNCSPRFGTRKADAVVWHFHGHGKIGRLPDYERLWIPAFHEAWSENFAGIRDWAWGATKSWVQSIILSLELVKEK